MLAPPSKSSFTPRKLRFLGLRKPMFSSCYMVFTAANAFLLRTPKISSPSAILLDELRGSCYISIPFQQKRTATCVTALLKK